ncbi:MAG: hypothetical protein GKS00_09255 [Alphaproteobacteria bacterium]|nr:hypothetical protein [Alphaproteobacteria bacterium]
MTPFPIAAFPAPGDDNRFAVLLGDDGNLYVSDGVAWNQVASGSSVPDFSALPAGAKYQCFRILVRNNGGVIQHAIISPFDLLLNLPFPSAGDLASKINNASNTQTNTPIGLIASLTPTAGAMIPTDGLEVGSLILDTAAFGVGELTGTWTLGNSNLTTVRGVFPTTISETINGVTKQRIYLVPQQSNNATVRLDTMTDTQFVTIYYAGYMI